MAVKSFIGLAPFEVKDSSKTVEEIDDGPVTTYVAIEII
jgi:hypothetical protein